MLTLVFLGEILHEAGLRGIVKILQDGERKLSAEVIVVNGNGISAGEGISLPDAKELFENGIDIIILGDKALSKPSSRRALQAGFPLLRPINFPANAPGQSAYKLKCSHGELWFLSVCIGSEKFPLGDPANAFDSWMEQETPECPVVLNVHGTDLPLKEALMLRYSDYKVPVHVLGTGIRVPTDDLRLLGGNVFVSDIGSVVAEGTIQGLAPQAWWKRYIERLSVVQVSAISRVKADGIKIVFDDTLRVVSADRLKIFSDVIGA
ncbi:YmdB family metallophosphoesterase [bacterium]|nr:YmdB family metallophosphoesterase [bacterium]